MGAYTNAKPLCQPTAALLHNEPSKGLVMKTMFTAFNGQSIRCMHVTTSDRHALPLHGTTGLIVSAPY